MNFNTSYGAFRVEQKDKDGNVIRLYWRRYVDNKHKNEAKRLRRAVRSGLRTAKMADPWMGRRKRFYRLKPNSPCRCGATWPENDEVTIRAGKAKKYKKCCMR